MYNNLRQNLCQQKPFIKMSFEIDLQKSYLAMIKNSVGSKMFRNRYFFMQGKSKDILENGSLSCAFYVSSILYLNGLITAIHCTVDGTVKDMQKSGWRKIKRPAIGSVLVWDKDKHGHKHIGFYIGKNLAVSNSSTKKVPTKHDLHYRGRKIIGIYFHPKLKEP